MARRLTPLNATSRARVTRRVQPEHTARKTRREPQRVLARQQRLPHPTQTPHLHHTRPNHPLRHPRLVRVQRGMNPPHLPPAPHKPRRLQRLSGNPQRRHHNPRPKHTIKPNHVRRDCISDRLHPSRLDSRQRLIQRVAQLHRLDMRRTRLRIDHQHAPARITQPRRSQKRQRQLPLTRRTMRILGRIEHQQRLRRLQPPPRRIRDPTKIRDRRLIEPHPQRSPLQRGDQQPHNLGVRMAVADKNVKHGTIARHRHIGTLAVARDRWRSGMALPKPLVARGRWPAPEVSPSGCRRITAERPTRGT